MKRHGTLKGGGFQTTAGYEEATGEVVNIRRSANDGAASKKGSQLAEVGPGTDEVFQPKACIWDGSGNFEREINLSLNGHYESSRGWGGRAR